MKTELRVLFFSPIAWIVLVVFAFQVGIEYCEELSYQMKQGALGQGQLSLSGMIAGRGVISAMLKNLYLYIPLLTMSLMSREFSSGSIKLLYSSPVSNIQIIGGKYLSMIVYSLILIAILMIPTIYTIFVIENPDIPMMMTAMLGLFLTVATYAAIGLFMSTITKYQVVAAVATLATLALFKSIGSMGQDYDVIRDITYWLSTSGRSETFLKGMICTKDILYFLLIIATFLSLSIIKLRGERLRLSKWGSALKYLIVCVLAVVIGYVSSLPKFTVYYDATAAKQNSLSLGSQEIMKKLKGPLTMTTYSNFLDESWARSSHRSRNSDLVFFQRFTRFKPDMKMDYVFYWGPGTNRSLSEKYPNLTTEELFKKQCRNNDYSESKFVSYKDIKDDISQENGRFVRVLKYNGKISYLRKYNDSRVDPTESDVMAAFKRLVDKSPIIAFLTGHGERGCYDHSEKGYGPFATNVSFRHALVNQGFTVREISFDEPVPADVDVIVISDMKTGLTEQQFENYNSYVDNGGNLFVLGEVRRQDFMNPVVAKLGLKFADGILVAPSSQYLDDIIAAQVMPSALKVSKYFNKLINDKLTVITPSACAVEVVEDKGFKITEILATKDKGSWIETETTDFVNEKSEVNPKVGEVEKSNSVMLHLNRQVNGKDQRIFVIGDADCIAKAELTKRRAGLNGNNFAFVKEIFRNFSYDEYPVETVRERPIDNKLYMNATGLVVSKAIFIWVLPFSILFWGCIFLIRRKRK